MSRTPELSALVQRSTVAVLSLIAVTVVMLIADTISGMAGIATMTPPLLLGVARLALLELAFVVIRLSRSGQVVAGTMLAAIVLHIAVAILLGHARGQPENVLITAVAVSMGAAVLIPWGWACQAMLVLASLVLLVGANALGMHTLAPPILAVIGIGAILATIYLSREIDETRQKLAARIREDNDARDKARKLYSELESTIQSRTASLEATSEELARLCHATSHDLRPPLRTMSGYSEILRESYGSQGRTDEVVHLNRIVELAATMGTRIDELLRDVRSAHRSIADSLLSLSDIARSEQVLLASRNSRCRWEIENGVVANRSAETLADFLRSLLRYSALAAGSSAAREIGFGCRDIAGTSTCFVRVSRAVTDGAMNHREIGEYLSGTVPFAQVPDELVDVVAAARALVARQGGAVWLTSDEGGGTTFWFRGSTASMQQEYA